MKKLLLSLILLANLNTYSQEKEFVITNEGYSKFVVEEIQNLKKEEIYSKALDWVLLTYKNPEKVITVKKENEFIRVNGSQLGDEIVFEIAVKDGKYKFSLLSYQSSAAGVVVSLMDVKNMLNDEGKVKWIYGGHKTIIKGINGLNKSLKEYIENGIPVSKQDW
jgi:SNF2 family DNA or RNA helicase